MKKHVKRLISILCIAAMLLALIPAYAENDISQLQVTGIVNCNKLKLRATPSAEARTLGTYNEGTKVIVLRNDGEWCQVVLDEKTGYMMTKYLDITTPYTSQGFARTSSDAKLLNMYDKPDTSSAITYKVTGGAAFEIIEDLGAWCKVRSGSVIGYVESANLTRTEAALQVFTYIGENNPYADTLNEISKIQQLGSGKGMSVSRGQYTSSVRYPVLALGIADAAISSFIHGWSDAAQADYEAYHSDKSASLNIDYNAEKLDDHYASVILAGTYQVDGLNSVVFSESMLVNLETGDVVNGRDLFSAGDRIAFQLEVSLDKVFDGYVEEYCTGIDESLLSRAALTGKGVEFRFAAGEILPLQLGPQKITLPYYRTYELIALDTPFIDRHSRVIDPTKPMIALTFDDGPSEETLRIVAELEKYNSRGTFCVVGSRLEAFESVLRETVAAGQEIGNHTWNHRNLEEISADNARSQISRVNEAVYEMTGYTIKVLRPPYGANNKRVRNICGEMDMYLAHWKLDTQDWVSRNTSKVYKKIIREVENGAIILCHDLYSTTADAVIQAIPELISDGYQLVTVTEMLSFHKDGIIPGTTYSRIDPANIDINK